MMKLMVRISHASHQSSVRDLIRMEILQPRKENEEVHLFVSSFIHWESKIKPYLHRKTQAAFVALPNHSASNVQKLRESILE